MLETSRTLLEKIAACQKVDPYSGWNLPELNAIRELVSAISKRPTFIDCSDPMELELIQKFLRCHGAWYKAMTRSRGWRMTDLNMVADEIRRYLNLPSIDDLNPELAKMKAHLKENRGKSRKTLADLIRI